MVIAMRAYLLLITLMLFLVTAPAWSQEEISAESGRVELMPDTEENTISIPMDEETGTVDWAKYWALPDGMGANWGFITVLYPPDPSALTNIPDYLLDGAWYPPIPFEFGYAPTATSSQATLTGWWYLEDASGYLARRDTQITTADNSWAFSTWFMGGGWIFHIEEGWASGYFTDGYYLPDDWSGPGIDYFIRSVWFRGITGGERMQALLQICGAQRIGQDYMAGGTNRLSIYQIPANETDRQNGRGSLLVWLTNGDYRLQRTRLHTVYATEVTQFENVSSAVQIDPDTYFSYFIPEEVYWSIDQYLLTHVNDFFNPGSNTTVTNQVTEETTTDSGSTGTADDAGARNEEPESVNPAG